jgi:FAD/FMN-containing dehydrogenase/Fe-S oxidoreductase
MAIETRAQQGRTAAAPGEPAAALRRALRGEVRDDPYTRHLFASDASMYAREPLAVAFPRDAGDVAAAIEIAGRFGIPVIPRGAGTSLAGQAIGAGGLVLDTSRHMNAIGEIDLGALRVRVEPGAVQEDLNRAAHRHGLGFGPDTSTANRATIGGMIGNNSSGSHSIVYGTTIDHVQELEVVLSDGSRARLHAVDEAERERRAQAPTLEGAIYRGVPEILRDHRAAIANDYPKHWRQSGGYRLDRLAAGPFDLAKLVAGSEGTLAAITAATVGLVPLPPVRRFAVGHFDSLDAAIGATEAALALEPAAVELIDRTILELSRSRLEYRRLADTIVGDPEALLFVTVFADDEASARAQLDRLDWDASHTLRADTPAEQKALTTVRQAGLGLLMSASTGARRPLAFVEDTAVAPERLPEYVARFREVLERHGLTAGWYGHCSVGCLHIRPFVDLTAPGGVETMQAVAGEIVDLVAEFDGVNSSEHGDGRARSAFARRIFGDDLYEAMRRVKGLFDPRDRLNPGMMVDGRAIAADLRDPALPPPGPLATRFAFPDGMRAAADRCQRIGACRKTGAGVMCPSYMATRDEDHATRGRANALVKALSAPDPHAAMGAERLHEILDLCLECKACKSECPLGVDMATMKSEFLAHHQEIHGVPLRSRLFGSIRTLNRIGAATAPLSNLAARAAPLVGIARERSLPRFERDTLVRWHRRRAKGTDPVPDVASDHPHAGGLSPGARGEAIFLADCFTTYTEPAVGRAAIELLEAAGWRVRLESAGCCGRASISKGLLDQAHRMASDMVDRLGEAAARGVPIVGCEPSCLLTLREEYLSLLADDPRAEAVARQARLVEELLAEDDALRLSPGAQRVVLHGHCHQKALAGTEATVALLKRIPGAEVVELDAGCCGMAGSFGFEAEHYELSMQIGETRLFPALRSEQDGSLVAATGVSCRQQIAHGVGREARHPVQLVRAAL